jgi:predicted ATP-dependent protease
LIRLAGDRAILDESELIEADHVRKSLEEAKPIEHQIRDRYGSLWKGFEVDSAVSMRSGKKDEGYV